MNYLPRLPRTYKSSTEHTSTCKLRRWMPLRAQPRRPPMRLRKRAEPAALYVQRGGRHYSPAHKARLKPGEPVFVKEAEGTFQFIGDHHSRADLPDVPITLP